MNSLLENNFKEIRKKANLKLNNVFSLPESQLPDLSVVEQASSETTASFVASIIGNVNVLADLTAGLGVNTFLFSKCAATVYAVEINERRAEVLSHNLKICGITNVRVINDNCIEWLKKSDLKFDICFVDPSRREKTGKKSIRFEDCEPEIDILLELLLDRTDRLIVKASPLLDISNIVIRYKSLRRIYILELHREVKELILDFRLSEGSDNADPQIIVVNLNDNGQHSWIDFKWSEKVLNSSLTYLQIESLIKDNGYIYDPSPAIKKASFYGSLVKKFSNLQKFAPNSNLFYSDSLYENFPGRIFRVQGLVTSKDLKKIKKEEYSVISRNHPASSEELTQRFQLFPSENNFLIATTINNKKIIIKALKVNNSK